MIRQSSAQLKFLALLGIVFGLVGLAAGCIRNAGMLPKNNSDLSVIDQPQPGEVAVLDSQIIIQEPLSNQVVASPIKISGRVESGGQILFFQILDSRQAVLATSSLALAAGAGQWLPYSGEIAYQNLLVDSKVL